MTGRGQRCLDVDACGREVWTAVTPLSEFRRVGGQSCALADISHRVQELCERGSGPVLLSLRSLWT